MKSEAPPQKMRMSRGRNRVVANRQQILTAAREIGVCDGWKAVTIRALADRLGYAAPVLYQHFRNKEDVLTQVAVEGLEELNRDLRREKTEPATAILLLARCYWNYMLEHRQMYRLMNGMDGVPVDGSVLRAAARQLCEITGAAISQWMAARGTEYTALEELTDTVWALLHGMASLYLDRAADFRVSQANQAVLQLLLGAAAAQKERMPVTGIDKKV